MVLLKAGVLLAALRSPAARPFRSTARIRLGQQITRRGYASHGGHGPKPSSSDLPWLVQMLLLLDTGCETISEGFDVGLGVILT